VVHAIGHPRRIGVGVVVAAVAALAAPAGAEADDVVSRQVTSGSSEVRGYWTPARMAGARPASELLAGLSLPAEPVGAVLGGGEPGARSAAQPVTNTRAYPARTHGKVFFHLPSGDYVCSGTVVRARNKRLVATAGHCVFGDGTFADHWMFVPGKGGSSEPFGRWVAARLAAPRRWQASEDLRYDVGMATMRKRNGRRLQKVVGARGIAFNQGRNLHFDAFGYPALPPFGGARLYRCSSKAQGTDSGPSPAATRIDCDMTGGASGGGWIIGHRRVNSVTSYGYDPLCPALCPDPDGEKLYGPYFGATIEKLYRSQRRKAGAG